jgi:hypothetical protein
VVALPPETPLIRLANSLLIEMAAAFARL